MRKPFKEKTIFEVLTKHLGVKYIYEEMHLQENENQTETLTTETFKIMPQEWIIRLSEAGLEVDTEKVMTLIQEIPESEAFLAKNLSKLVRQFQVEQILDLIEPLIT